MKKVTTPFLISQSFMNDAFKTEGDQPKDKILPQYCPRYLKYKYVDGLRTPPSDAMQCGNYFEWHLLGATRDGIEPVLPRINIKDLRPTKSASKDTMIEYLVGKGYDMSTIKGTGKQKDLKPSTSSSIAALTEYCTSKGVIFSTTLKLTKTEILATLASLPEDLGEPTVTTEDLFAIIQTMPPEYTEGDLSTQQQKLDQVIGIAKSILLLMGLDPSKGLKQLRVVTAKKSGHFDWVTNDFEEADRECIIDIKFTKTKEDDWRNGWGDIDTKTEAHIQATHYTVLHHETTGKWVPFYFFIFGEDGWIKIIKMVMTETGLSVYNMAVNRAEELLSKFQKSDWKARPEFNRCLKCPFSEVCDQRAVLPQVTEFYL